MTRITPDDDAKLQHLKGHVLGKITSPINPANKKILIFTAFADTADYLYANLAPVLQALKLHTGKHGDPASSERCSDWKSEVSHGSMCSRSSFSPKSFWLAQDASSPS